jgi:hypothetical protein
MRRRELVVEPSRRSERGAVATLRIGWRRRRVSIEAPGGMAGACDDPFVPIGLLLGMATGRDVIIEGPVSAPLLASLEAVRQDLKAWYPDLHAPALQAVAAASSGGPPTPGRGIAAFFSGGLDSFHTAITHAREITHLVFVHGFDVQLHEGALREQVAQRVRQAASLLGKPLLEVVTDLRSVSDAYANWAWFSHAGLVAVALFLAQRFEEILVPATLAAAHRPPELRGRIDRETWSGGACRIRTDGAEATRPEKARAVAHDPAARAHLRVCWENRGGAYNCGRCPKCVRTLLDLEVAGVRGAFTSFPATWDLAAVREVPVATRSDRQFLEECLWMAEAEGGRPDLVAVLRERLGQAI